MDTIQNAVKQFRESRKKIKTLQNRIAERQQQIARLENRIDKLYDTNFWGDIILRPIMDDVIKKYPQITFEVDRYIPLGMAHRVSIFGKTKDNKTIMLAFTPTNLLSDTLDNSISIDTLERTNEYAKGSIGELNGFNRVEKPIQTMLDVYAIVDKQLNEK